MKHAMNFIIAVLLASSVAFFALNLRMGLTDGAVILRDGIMKHQLDTSRWLIKYQEEYNKQQLQRLQRRSTQKGIRS